MQFNHPEVLYALFLLIIPVIVHLFRLRRFRKEAFTNVKFLKRISKQTRNSSQLKKWLVLISRLLLLTCIILAFADPYFPGPPSQNKNINTLIYLDNSYSMQARGPHGVLLDRSIQELLQNLPEDENFGLFTNNAEFKEVTKADLQDIGFSSVQLNFKTILLKAKNLMKANAANKLLLISDFQKNIGVLEDSTGLDIYAYLLKPESLENKSIDSIYMEGGTSAKKILKVKLGSTGNDNSQSAVSLYNGSQLLGKSSVNFNAEKTKEIEFPLDLDSLLEGKIEIEDNGLQYDNTLFFSYNKTPPVKVVSINAQNDDFLKRIFTIPEFDFKSMPPTEIQYSQVSEAQVIVLNEIQDISTSLKTLLEKKLDQNAVFIVIPPDKKPETNYSAFLSELGASFLKDAVTGEKLVTGISFENPLYKGVFEDKVNNFDYPKVQRLYRFNSTSAILAYEDKSPFLFKKNGNYFFTAPLNSQNTNFRQSPLIVPTFYNMGISAVRSPALFYWLQQASFFDVPIKTESDKVLHITSGEINSIPQQQQFTDKVTVETGNLEIPAGNYELTYKDEPVMAVSFNVDRAESKLEYESFKNYPRFRQVKDLSTFFHSGYFQKEYPLLWKWFVIFALLFLMIETLLLKFIK